MNIFRSSLIRNGSKHLKDVSEYNQMFKCVSYYSTQNNRQIHGNESNDSDFSKLKNLEAGQAENGSREQENIPWYLRDEVTSNIQTQNALKLPEVPASAPESIHTFLRLLVQEYGMENILLFDMTSLPLNHEQHPDKHRTKYNIICTGKSPRHIFKASNALRLHLKHNHGILAGVEGAFSGARSPLATRRLLRRAGKAPSSTDNEYGRSANTWVMCDTQVDDIYIHLLTSERREDLNLESLWCEEADLINYAPKAQTYEESDSIFSGIRGFHTSTLFYRNWAQSRFCSSEARSRAQSFVSDFKKQSLSITTNDVAEYLKSVDSSFDKNDLEDHASRYEFYKSVHLLNPAMVSFDDVSFALLEKYSNLRISLNSSLDFSELKSRDLSDYMKLLLDSPEIMKQYNLKEENQIRAYSDELFDRLSKFIGTLHTFSQAQINLEKNDIIPLLWRLTFYSTNGLFVSPKMVDDVILNNSQIPKIPYLPHIIQNGNKVRTILDLILYYNGCTSSKNYVLSPAFQELMLFTYGNAAKWAKFWNYWDSYVYLSIDPQNPSTNLILTKWVRLIIYLSIMNNRSATLHFFQNYWSVPSGLAGSFIDAFEANSRTFSSEKEKQALILALENILRSANESYGSDSHFLKSVSEFLAKL